MLDAATRMVEADRVDRNGGDIDVNVQRVEEFVSPRNYPPAAELRTRERRAIEQERRRGQGGTPRCQLERRRTSGGTASDYHDVPAALCLTGSHGPPTSTMGLTALQWFMLSCVSAGLMDDAPPRCRVGMLATTGGRERANLRTLVAPRRASPGTTRRDVSERCRGRRVSRVTRDARWRDGASSRCS
jgi:hypothetical protein